MPCAHEHPTKFPKCATHDEWHICKSILPSQLQCMPPMMSDIHARAYYHHNSSVYNLWWVTYMQECITTMTPVYATHDEWHICTTSDMCSRAHPISSVCHPQRVTYMQENITITTPVYATHDEWHICKRILLSLQYKSPTMSDICVWEHPVSSVCHPWRVTYMQEHITFMSLVCVTHDEWYICKSITLCLQYRSPTVSDIHARTYY